MTERSWVQTPTMETIFQAPFIWIKAWNKNCGKTLTWHCCMCCNPANGRVDFEEWLAYKIQLRGIEWIVCLSADWDQSPTKKKSFYCSPKLMIQNLAMLEGRFSNVLLLQFTARLCFTKMRNGEKYIFHRYQENIIVWCSIGI